ncbi:hypothetical protein BGX31_008333 [Mortierella sp. GBA43]|nr:hypothetical protein BGX31_008333 [Mortierella sp. GBA43]
MFVPLLRANLSPKKALDLARIYLENARNTEDLDIAMVLCQDTEVSLTHARKTLNKDPSDQTSVDDIATAYVDLGKLLVRYGYGSEAQSSFKKAAKLGWNVRNPDPTHRLHPTEISQASDSAQTLPVCQIVTISPHIFTENIRPPCIEFKPPKVDEPLACTLQLACCLNLLQRSHLSDGILEPAADDWLKVVEKDMNEQERLRSVATEVIRAFIRDDFKDAKIFNEAVCLVPVLDEDVFQDFFRALCCGINKSNLLSVHQLDGIARSIQGAGPGCLDADHLAKVLGLLSTHLRDAFNKSTHHIHQLTWAVSHILDAMADARVSGLDRDKLRKPLSEYLVALQKSSDPYLVYQAAYASQALLCVPDDETLWQAGIQRAGKVIPGFSGRQRTVKGLDLNEFMEGLVDIQKGSGGAPQVAEVQPVYYDITSLAKDGARFLQCLKEGLSFERKRDWYSALRGADILIRDGKLSTFRKLVCEVPCRLDPAFQWGVCQRLGEIAINPMWDAGTRQGAIDFLGEIYQNDEAWGKQMSVKQWIIDILVKMASLSGPDSQCK